MPIYEYRCSSCGHQQEFLQKVSDATLTVCTACGQSSFVKMLTAAGFQLKGSGWYATDFKNRGAAPAGKADAKAEGGNKSAEDKPAEGKPAEGKPAEGKSTESKPAEGKSTEGKSTEGKSTESKTAESKTDGAGGSGPARGTGGFAACS